jgi:hypothetical protein
VSDYEWLVELAAKGLAQRDTYPMPTSVATPEAFYEVMARAALDAIGLRALLDEVARQEHDPKLDAEPPEGGADPSDEDPDPLAVDPDPLAVDADPRAADADVPEGNADPSAPAVAAPSDRDGQHTNGAQSNGEQGHTGPLDVRTPRKVANARLRG